MSKLWLPGVAWKSQAPLARAAAASELGRVRKCAGARSGSPCWQRKGLVLRSQTGSPILMEEAAAVARGGEKASTGFTIVMSLGESSPASAERIREVANLILHFPEGTPVVVLSTMGKARENLLLAGENPSSVYKACEIFELSVTRDLNLRTIDELGLDRSVISGLLDELEQFLKGIASMKELTLRTRDYLLSFGERMSTRIFAAYMNKLGKKARQYDAFDIGFITTDDFTNAGILEVTYPLVAKRLHGDWMDNPTIPIVSGFVGKGFKPCAVTTLGRDGSDLTATTIVKALGLKEIQFLHPQSMRPAQHSGIRVRVQNSHNSHAPGTVIPNPRDMSKFINRHNSHATGTIVAYPAPRDLGSKLFYVDTAARPGGASLKNKNCVVQYQRGSGSINRYLIFEDSLKIIKSKDLIMLEKLGRGSTGTVYHALLNGTDDVAVKLFADVSPTQRGKFFHEANIQSKLSHPNLLKFHGVVEDRADGQLGIVTEFMVDGSLWHVLRNRDKYPLDDYMKLKIAKDVAYAMAYMHSENFAHNDLKGGNLMMDLKDKTLPICKVGDFDLSKFAYDALFSGGMKGTVRWMAPELLNGLKEVSNKVDVYSYGIILWEILTGEVPYSNTRNDAAIMWGVKNNTLRPSVPAHCDPEWRRLMENCWAHDFTERPNFPEILEQLRAMSTMARYAKSVAN